MLNGVTKPVVEESNYSVIGGRLKHLSLFDNLPINYLHSYIYVRGLVAQDIHLSLIHISGTRQLEQ